MIAFKVGIQYCEKNPRAFILYVGGVPEASAFKLVALRTNA